MIDHSALSAPLRDLRRVAALPDGWHFGAGVSPTVAAKLNATALTLTVAGAGVSKFEYFPEECGGILIIAYRGYESAEILATGDGTYELAFENDQGLSPAKSLASINEVQADLEHRGWRLRKSSDSFTRVITVSERTGTLQWHFAQAAAVFPSSILHVSNLPGFHAAYTPKDIIPGVSEVPPQYSGVSKLRNLLLVAS